MLELYEEVSEKSCKVLGEEHPDTLANLNNLAVGYGDVGNYEKSLELHEEVYEKRCKLLGEEHPDTLKSLHNSALVCIEMWKIMKNR